MFRADIFAFYLTIIQRRSSCEYIRLSRGGIVQTLENKIMKFIVCVIISVNNTVNVVVMYVLLNNSSNVIIQVKTIILDCNVYRLITM